jgi:phosphopentomutase
LASILPLEGVPPAREPVLHGRLHALGPGKDSTAGHWELMGVVSRRRPPTFPDGFPAEVTRLITATSGRTVICNRPSNGIEAIERFGAEHVRTGALIVYTSQDSVLQIAAHVDVVEPPALYEICQAVRRQLPERHAVGRVIARPFTGGDGAFERTEGRRDFALPPPVRSYLAELDAGLVFTNLIETDQVYGHRHDAAGFHAALREIDSAVAGWLDRLGPDDLLVLTADHGCDVTAAHTDHTREHAPLLAVFDGHGSRRHDGPLADVGASVLAWLTGREAPALPGGSFVAQRSRVA